MTSEVFLETLDSKLDFMAYKDRVKILSFYSDKILAASSPEEELGIIEGFGDIDLIAEKIKVKYQELTDFRSKGDTLTFNPEIINDLSKTTSGEESIGFSDPTKTFTEIKKNPKSEKFPGDESDEVSDEDSEKEKTRKFSTKGVSVGSKRRIPVREIHSGNEDPVPAPKQKVKELWLPDTEGLFGIILKKLNVSKQMRPVVFTLLLILFTPLLLVLTALLFMLYVASIAVILSIAIFLFLLVVIPVVIAVIDMSYGIIMLFSNITAALIEIGIGTMIFGVVIALIGFGYQLVAGAIPSILKKLTALYKYGFAIFKILVFGK
ncbi:MAG: hypothetical protein E7665_06715 [Ruminococcaceae bacterium]|nr:hypothetical protein [Oscillospiraceae bacterium]